MTAVQVCKFCQVAKPATREYFGSTPGGGLRQKCRACMNEYSSRYGAANRDRQKERNQKRKDSGGHVVLTDDQKSSLYLHQRGVCLSCGETLQDLRFAHVDHLLPVCQGGGHEMTNLFLAHPQCNLEKHRKSLAEHWNWRLRVGLATDKGAAMLRLAEELKAALRSDKQGTLL